MEPAVKSLAERRMLLSSAVVVIALLGVTACTSHPSKSASSSTGSAFNSQGMRTGGGSADSAVGMPAGPAAGPPSAKPSSHPLLGKDFVRTATLELQVADVDKAVDSISAQATKSAGQVETDHRTGTDAKRVANLVLRVPPQHLNGLIADAANLGKELNRSITGEDVSTAHADINARVLALQTSVTRLRDLLSHSGSISDLVALENQLSSRESELESTIAQRASLEGSIALSSLSIEFSQRPLVAARAKHGPFGFVSAIVAGWHATMLVLRWGAALIGYALPFLLIAAILALPAVALLRRRNANGEPPRPAEPAAEATP
jgi:hypothetical protein